MERTAYEGKFVRVTEEEIGGRVYERAHIVEGVSIIPFTKEGKILFIQEYRAHESPQLRWKLVSGMVEKGDDAHYTAGKELQEELGMKAGALKEYFVSVDKSTVCHKRTYFIATNLEDCPIPNPDGDSVRDKKALSIEDVYSKALAGEFGSAQTAYLLIKLCKEISEGRLDIQD